MKNMGDVTLVKGDVRGAISLAFGDLDGEGILAFVVNWITGKIIAYQIDFDKQDLTRLDDTENPLGDNLIISKCEREECQMTFFDIDSDGDLDILVGGENNFLQLFINHGTPSKPSFSLDEVSQLPDTLGNYQFGSGKSLPVIADTDGDGDLDLWVATSHGVELFENTAADCASQCTRGRGVCANEGLSSTFNDERDSFGLFSTSFAAGVCDCQPKFAGVACEQCDDTHYGQNCADKCPQN
ncbi:Tyrosine-protein kinase receptor Tie-1, partial [Hondaea fermentalgiana]